MTTFDYDTYPIVGALNIVNSSNGYVKVFGYLDGFQFHRFTESEIQNIFTPGGNVFARNITRNHSDKDGELISLYVKPTIDEGPGKTAYVWNWERDIEIVGSKIIQLNESLCNNGQSNYNILKENNLIDIDESTYVLSENRLFYIKPHSDSRLLPFCRLNESFPIVGDNSVKYYLGFSIPTLDESIDITTDEQLVDWFLRTSKIEWEDIQKGSGKNAIRAAKDALLSSKNLPGNIAQSRIERLSKMTDAFVLTRDNLKDIASASWLKQSLEAAIDKYKEDYISSVLEGNREELERIQADHQSVLDEENRRFESSIAELSQNKAKIESEVAVQIAAIQQELEEAKKELDETEAKVNSNQIKFDELENGIARIEKRKEDIVEDFKIVREVLNLSGNSNDTCPAVITNQLHYESLTDKKLPPLYKAYEKNLETCLKAYHLQVNSVTEIADLHAAYKVLVLPNVQTAMALISSAGRSWYDIAYVSAAWKSFDDLWKAGLQSIVEHCSLEPDTIHYFVVRNINLSCLPNYLQPLADMQGSYIKTFPKTDLAMPSNLRILLTVSDERLLPMSETVLMNFGCITRDITVDTWDPVHIAGETLFGYLETKLLNEASEHISKTNNYFQSYIDE